MNLREGFTRLLFILLIAVAFIVVLVQMLGFSIRSIGYFIAFWLALLLAGLVAGYCILYFGRLIGHLFRGALNKGQRKEQRRESPEGEFRELIWVTAVITGAIAFFLIPLTSTGRETMPDHPINFVLSFSVFLITFCLVWAVYTIIRFIVAGFASSDKSG